MKEEPERYTVNIQPDVSRRFRKAVADSLGYKKGNLQIAFNDALDLWSKSRKAEMTANDQNDAISQTD